MQATLLLIDSILLTCWYFIDPLTRKVELFPEEAPPAEERHMDIMYEPQLEHCSCHNMNIWKGKRVCHHLYYYHINAVMYV